jgi:hypothetical protein
MMTPAMMIWEYMVIFVSFKLLYVYLLLSMQGLKGNNQKKNWVCPFATRQRAHVAVACAPGATIWSGQTDFAVLPSLVAHGKEGGPLPCSLVGGTRQSRERGAPCCFFAVLFSRCGTRQRKAFAVVLVGRHTAKTV